MCSSDLGRGPGAVPVSFPWKGHSLLLGVNICYEAILPEYMRGYAQKGARLFVNLTKDSWFGDTFEPWQHFQLSILRSVENRIPMVRATNTGLSGSISFTGDIRLLSQPFEESYQIQEVKLPLSPEKTPYSLFGEWFALALICFVFGTAIWMKRFLP